ncbi:MAG: phosphoenolpyruvate synthase [Methanomassiliicoccaceae archaeon]|jgi:pyruvate,water dikinase|nr:phosphoenolpyruvate synthase [Methanomassiliicoccaceae archaeon]
MQMKRIATISELRVNDIPYVGGKGANLGELTSAGFPVPDAFVLTTVAYDHFMDKSKISDKVEKELASIRKDSDQSLTDASARVRGFFEQHEIPADLKKEILDAYSKLFPAGKKGFVAVRSSATAEDLPDASFAGQQETFLNVSTPDDLLDKVRKCWSSLFTARAISYRDKQGFDHTAVKLAVVVQRMVNSEASGIMFTVDPNTGKDDIIVEAGFGLGEAIVGGEVTPDMYVVNKGHMEIVKKRIATQKWKYIKGESGATRKADVPKELQKAQKIEDKFIIEVASIGRQIEIHYERPMDIEWCIEDNRVYIVQARPVTATGDSSNNETASDDVSADVLTTGLGASPGLATGPVKFFDDGMSLDIVKEGDVLVTTMTMPDMVPAMSRAVAIVTDEGGMTCHAAIISRELGTPCVVGTGDATSALRDGMIVTVDGTSGVIYAGDVTKPSTGPAATQMVMAPSAPITGTKVMVNLSMPNKAEEVAKLPVDGVGLMRIEFLFTNYIGEHPQYVIANGRSEELVNKLAEGIGKVARAFYPRPVILRTSDFKSNEYRDMKGGIDYEPMESNPMIGWRGCSRYVSDNYREAYMCELRAIKKVRDEMGMKNLWVMLPFVRTIEEVEDITEMMRSVGLRRSKDFKLYFMAEVPVNIFMADEFCKHCDAFSIGSNDLTQLVMGADRDSDILGRMGYFDERNEGVKRAISHLIRVAHENNVPVSICGQAPSVYPEFTEFLIREGIDSVSLNPDTVIKTKTMIASVEQKLILEGMNKLRSKL